MVSVAEGVGLTVEESVESASAVLEEGVGIASEDDAAPDEFSLGVADAAALEDERVAALDEGVTLDGFSVGVVDGAELVDGRGELAGADESPAVVLEDGTTTIPVGVTDDSTEETSEVSNENVGKGWEEADAELTMLVEDAAGAELGALLDGALADEDTTGTRLEV